jgi:hypothetical protein
MSNSVKILSQITLVLETKVQVQKIFVGLQYVQKCTLINNVVVICNTQFGDCCPFCSQKIFTFTSSCTYSVQNFKRTSWFFRTWQNRMATSNGPFSVCTLNNLSNLLLLWPEMSRKTAKIFYNVEPWFEK